jgi:hypothetical protein
LWWVGYISHQIGTKGILGRPQFFEIFDVHYPYDELKGLGDLRRCGPQWGALTNGPKSGINIKQLWDLSIWFGAVFSHRK